MIVNLVHLILFSSLYLCGRCICLDIFVNDGLPNITLAGLYFHPLGPKTDNEADDMRCI